MVYVSAAFTIRIWPCDSLIILMAGLEPNIIVPCKYDRFGLRNFA